MLGMHRGVIREVGDTTSDLVHGIGGGDILNVVIGQETTGEDKES